MSTVISVENLSKVYRLGQIGTGTFTNDMKLWWAKRRGKPNPLLRIGEADHGNRDGEDLWALRDVSFTVERGEVLGIIGRNGAGKSTLLKILSRVTAPTSGKIKVKGRVASLLEVGTGFHPDLTGRENIYLNGAILGMKTKEIDRKFDEIVDFSEVEKFIDTPVKRYSSGMYVRLAFAVAAHLEPEILVVDEVLAVGDAAFQKKCLGKMGEVTKEGRTVLFVSHNMEAVDKLTSRALLLDSGTTRVIGPTMDVVKNYLQRSILSNKHLSEFRISSILNTAEILDIWTESTSGERISAFRQGESFRIILHVEKTHIPCDFALVIENYKENPLFTTHLTDFSEPLVNGGGHLFAAEIEKPILRRGKYLISAAAFSPDKRLFFDVVHHFPVFEIAGTLGASYPDDIRWGDLYIPIKWNMVRSNE